MRKMADASVKDTTLSPDVKNVGQFKPRQDQGRLREKISEQLWEKDKIKRKEKPFSKRGTHL